jgi:F-type H+-transporting ATPase subunit b
MLIDWFTVSAQAVNFLILVWLLKRFLYKPVLEAVAAREQRLTQQWQDAAASKAAAEQQGAEFQRNNAELTQQRSALLAQATSDAQAARTQLLEAARTEAAALRTQWQQSLHKEQLNLNQHLLARAQHEVFAITRKTLGDLASTGLETRISEVFIQRLHGLGEPAKALLRPAPETSPALIRSAFPLPAAEQAALVQAVQQNLGVSLPPQFEIAPELVSGIELSSNGHKLSWNITEYLAALEASISAVLDGTSHADG